MIMFLAHFSPGLGNPLKMKSKECYKWYNQAVKLHTQLNKVEENG
jgi:hypothetical protein